MIDSKEKEKLMVSKINVDVGLTKEEVAKRIELGQTNETPKGSTKTIGGIIFSNIFTFFNMLIFGIVFFLLYVEAYKDILFSGIVILNIFIGIFQEIKAKKTIDKLSLLTAPVAQVLRDGEIIEIAIKEVVLNDLLSLTSGNQISADAIVRKGLVEVDESLLTGESRLVVKKEGDFLYSGSYIASGYCLAETVKVGKDAYIETLTSKAKRYQKPNSDLLNSLNYILKTIAIFIIPIGFLLFNMQYNVLDEGLVTSIRQTAGALVGMIPAGLFLLTSVALAVGVIRLSQRNTLVQELYCIEMLARVDTLCLDKTGTITDGTMEVRGVVDINRDINHDPKVIIPQMMSAFTSLNQTNEALIDKFGLPLKEPDIVEIINFSSARRYSAVEFKGLGTFLLGSPESTLVKTEYSKIKNKVEKYAKRGLRVLVYAHSPNSINDGKIPTSIKPISLFLIEDRVRHDAPATIEYFKAQGVDVKIISGDNPLTVANIAKRAGVNDSDNFISLEGMTNSEVFEAGKVYSVFGRVSPEQKEILIKSLKAQGKTVAMVGDGVNDILALREADASIAMASGSEAARNVSHLVMLDSNFSSMPQIVNEGRRVINNVQKVAALFLTKTIFSILLTIVVLNAGIRYPLSTNQLFLINVTVIGIPSFVISLQPNLDIVKGKFLPNVLKTAFPGALAIVAQISLILLVFNPQMGLTTIEQSTLIVVTSTFTSTVILYRLLRPFNLLRGVVYILTMVFATAALLFVPSFFEINALLPVYLSFEGAEIHRLSFDIGIVLMLLISTSSLFIDFFAKTPGLIDRGVRWFFRKLSGI